MLAKLFQTPRDPAALVARIALGLVMLPHGAQKALGWFGGHGMSGTLGFFQSMGIPTVLGLAAIAAEFLGSLGLLTGTLSRLSALGIAANMVVATLTVHLSNGFFMNWSGQQAGEGFEYHLLALGLALVVAIRGGGLWSVDALVARRMTR